MDFLGVVVPLQSWHGLLFVSLQFFATGYAIFCGGKPERYVGVAFICAYWLSNAVRDHILNYSAVDHGVLLIDLALLALLLLIALFADRRWPLLIVPMHAMTVMSHFPGLAGVLVNRQIYATLSIAWSYPMIVVLIIATWRHRQRTANCGPERDWIFRAIEGPTNTG